MIADKLLQLCSAQDAKTALTGEALDLNQEYPNLGSLTPPFMLIVTPSAVSGTAPITFNVQDSADKDSWQTVSGFTIKADDFTDAVVIPMPVKHRRYIRLTTTVDTTESKTATGTFSAILNNVYDLSRTKKFEGADTTPTVD